MSGRRRIGTGEEGTLVASALVKDAEDRRAFQQRLVEAGIKAHLAPLPAMSEAEATRLSGGLQFWTPYPVAPSPRITTLKSPTDLNPDRMVQHVTGTIGGLPSSPSGRVFLQSQINSGATESPGAEFAKRPSQPVAQAPQIDDDPIVRTGRDEATGKRVGQTRSGRIVVID